MSVQQDVGETNRYHGVHWSIDPVYQWFNGIMARGLGLHPGQSALVDQRRGRGAIAAGVPEGRVNGGNVMTCALLMDNNNIGRNGSYLIHRYIVLTPTV